MIDIISYLVYKISPIDRQMAIVFVKQLFQYYGNNLGKASLAMERRICSLNDFASNTLVNMNEDMSDFERPVRVQRSVT